YRPDDQAWTWASTGDSKFTLTPADRVTRGTTIEIKLKEDASEFANTWRLEQIIKKHSDYVSFHIYVKGKEGEEKIGNGRTGLWRQSPARVKSEECTEFYKQIPFDADAPLLTVHMVADAPANLRTLMFVPTKRERGMMRQQTDHGLRLYS